MNGDITKALVAASGATHQSIVMAGSLFAACVDAPGDSVYDRTEWTNRSVDGNGNTYEGIYYQKPAFGAKVLRKHYHGSASARQKGPNALHIEGFEVELPCNQMTIAEKMEDIKQSLQSAVSYAGGKDLSAFKDVAWVSTR